MGNKRKDGGRQVGRKTGLQNQERGGGRNAALTALALFFQVIMQAKVDFFGIGLAAGVFIKSDGLLQGVHKKQARVAIFHMPF